MVKQCFAIQNTYGLTAEQLKIRMQAMIIDLNKYPLTQIEHAFVYWRRENPNIPTPYDIIKTIKLLYSKSKEPDYYTSSNKPRPFMQLSDEEKEKQKSEIIEFRKNVVANWPPMPDYSDSAKRKKT